MKGDDPVGGGTGDSGRDADPEDRDQSSNRDDQSPQGWGWGRGRRRAKRHRDQPDDDEIRARNTSGDDPGKDRNGRNGRKNNGTDDNDRNNDGDNGRDEDGNDEDEEGEPEDDDERRRRRPYGVPGRPLRRSPFLLGYTAGLGVLAAYATYLAFRNAAGILLLIFIALFLAIGLHPAVVRLQRFHIPRGLAVAIVTLGVLLLLAAGIGALVPPLVTQVGDFIGNAPQFIRSLQRNPTINEIIERFHLVERAEQLASTENVSRLFGGVFGTARLLFGTIFRVLTVIVLTIYFMAAFDRIKAAAYGLVPASRRERVQLLADEILTKVGAYIVGALSIALLAGLSTFVFALIVGLPYPYALAVVVAIFDLIPQIGATVGAVIVSLVGLANSLTAFIASVVFFVIYQQVENYLIYPKVMRRSVKVSDVAAIVAALLGVALFGVIGALVAIPAVAAIQLIFREVLYPRQEAK